MRKRRGVHSEGIKELLTLTKLTTTELRTLLPDWELKFYYGLLKKKGCTHIEIDNFFKYYNCRNNVEKFLLS